MFVSWHSLQKGSVYLLHKSKFITCKTWLWCAATISHEILYYIKDRCFEFLWFWICSYYSTQLNKEDSAEFRVREERATRLAREIESSDTYNRNVAMEDGGGEEDEEKAFSAVIRSPGETNGKYVIPHLRKNPQDGRTKSWQSPPQQQAPPPPPAAASNNGPSASPASAAAAAKASSPMPGKGSLYNG